MFAAAFVVIEHDPNTRVGYQQQRSEGQRCGSAVVRVARERCDVISGDAPTHATLAQSFVVSSLTRLNRHRTVLLWCVVVVSLLATGTLALLHIVADGQSDTKLAQWSAGNGIASIDRLCLEPDAVVTRGEASVYIWNMENQPVAPVHGFVDVTVEGQNAAVSWMAHNEISSGTSPTTFSPDTALTRAQLVTFLWRLAGRPAAPAHAFGDVQAAWQQDSVSWAADQKITTGNTLTTFSPDNTLTFAQLITFLWRYQNQRAAAIESTTPHCATKPTFKTVSAGGGHSCGVKSDNTVICWGYNGSGQVEAPEGAYKTVSAGDRHSCGVKSDNTVTCWGYNGSGQAEVPDGAFNTVSVGSGYSCGVKSDNTVTCWGNNRYGQAEAPDGAFKTVSAGGGHSCGVKSDNTVTCWGYNGSGQVEVPDGAFKTVSAGDRHSCGVKSDNIVTCWGNNRYGQAEAPDGAFKTVSARGLRSCGVKSDNTVTCWGELVR